MTKWGHCFRKHGTQLKEQMHQVNVLTRHQISDKNKVSLANCPMLICQMLLIWDSWLDKLQGGPYLDMPSWSANEGRGWLKLVLKDMSICDSESLLHLYWRAFTTQMIGEYSIKQEDKKEVGATSWIKRVGMKEQGIFLKKSDRE